MRSDALRMSAIMRRMSCRLFGLLDPIVRRPYLPINLVVQTLYGSVFIILRIRRRGASVPFVLTIKF